jgi:hypothetical protein
MQTKDKNLDRVWSFLLSYPADFLLAYAEKNKETSPNLELKMAWSRRPAAKEEYDGLAAKYQEFATLCYTHQRNFILERGMHSRYRTSPGSEKPSEKTTSSSSPRRWHLFIANGPIRKAGYVVVARITAKDQTQVRKLIREIQIVFLGTFLLLRPTTILHLLLRAAGVTRKAVLTR